MKVCKYCGKEKELSEFIQVKNTKDGTISTCKLCSIERRRQKPRKEVTVTEKECFCCKQTKPANAFPKNRELNGGLHTWCRACVHKKLQTSGYYKLALERKKERLKTDETYRTKVNKEKRQSRARNIEKVLLKAAKDRAAKKNQEFNITIEDIVIPSICPILKRPLILGTKEDYNFSPSVDRINNELGYIKGNVQIISKKANMIKNSATNDELLLFAEWVFKTLERS